MVDSTAATQFQVIYSIASLNVFLFAMILQQKAGFTMGYFYIIVFQILGILSMHFVGEW